MAKTKTKTKGKTRRVTNENKAVASLDTAAKHMTTNGRLIRNSQTLLRRSALWNLITNEIDIDYECRYPISITKESYRKMYDREGLAERVVHILPEESWSISPEIKEDDTTDKTAFEEAWDDLELTHHITHYLERIDILSGIGRYGVLLFGLGDGGKLNTPAAGINPMTGEATNANITDRKLLYLRAFDESVVEIKNWEKSTSSPRFGFPTMYTLQFIDEQSSGTSIMQSVDVHWTRVIHVADNRGMSEIFGKPRMMSVFNRLLDVRKVLSGSGEMYWRGAFPGKTLDFDPEVDEASFDTDAAKEEIKDYDAGMQRWLMIAGAKVRQLHPEIVDPKGHVEAHVKYIALSKGIPFRIFLGSEEAKLASINDSVNWNKRVAKRQVKYLSPMLVRPSIDRLIAYGVLSTPDQYEVEWADLNTTTDKEDAEVSEIKTNALAKYVAGNVDQLVPPKEYLMGVMGLTEEEAEAVEEAATERNDTINEEERAAAIEEEDRVRQIEEQQRRAEAADRNNPTPVRKTTRKKVIKKKKVVR